MRETNNTRRAGHFGEGQHDGLGVETERTTGVQSHSTKNNRLAKDAQTASGQCYTETDQLHRKREAQARIRRTREQRHAAKYFYGLQRGCVRRV